MININANVEKRAVYAFKEIAKQFHAETEKDYYSTQTINQVTFEMKYLLEKRWLSKIYKLQLTFTLPNTTDINLGEYHWNISKNCWKKKNGQVCPSFYKELRTVFKTVDIETAAIYHTGEQIKLIIILIPGSFVWTLVPPMHYFIRLKEHEVKTLKEVPSILERNILNYKKHA
ncbi:hypothetical protein CD798_12440 [Bacillaceae bacterium SAOS 7]|nr:hypothetical protein CD798_12440 [Bacillaceae bacterium SAOS 7]